MDSRPIFIDPYDKDVSPLLCAEDMQTYRRTRSDLLWGCVARPVERGSVHAAFDSVEVSLDFTFGLDPNR